jgi:Fe-S oxidoreductase
MNIQDKSFNINECIHCNICQKHCAFLRKYQLSIGDQERLESLVYHCFLCGKCSQVCPKGIDGREIILAMRRRQANAEQAENIQKTYKRTISEKREYSYRNYRHITKHSVLFPGCNFPSVYPKTTKKLVQLLKEEGIGVVYDCCGKPIADLGMQKDEFRIINEIVVRMQKAGVDELITLCPNCYEFLKTRLPIKVISIYEKLQELGVGGKITGNAKIFPPCPDRKTGEWMKEILPYIDGECSLITDISCCGLGGHGGVKEPELAQIAPKKLKNCSQTIYTYCGSCAGHLTRNGCQQVRHVLPEILGTHEKPDTLKSLMNRMKTKYL